MNLFQSMTRRTLPREAQQPQSPWAAIQAPAPVSNRKLRRLAKRNAKNTLGTPLRQDPFVAYQLHSLESFVVSQFRNDEGLRNAQASCLEAQRAVEDAQRAHTIIFSRTKSAIDAGSGVSATSQDENDIALWMCCAQAQQARADAEQAVQDAETQYATQNIAARTVERALIDRLVSLATAGLVKINFYLSEISAALVGHGRVGHEILGLNTVEEIVRRAVQPPDVYPRQEEAT